MSFNELVSLWRSKTNEHLVSALTSLIEPDSETGKKLDADVRAILIVIGERLPRTDHPPTSTPDADAVLHRFVAASLPPTGPARRKPRRKSRQGRPSGLPHK